MGHRLSGNTRGSHLSLFGRQWTVLDGPAAAPPLTVMISPPPFSPPSAGQFADIVWLASRDPCVRILQSAVCTHRTRVLVNICLVADRCRFGRCRDTQTGCGVVIVVIVVVLLLALL